MSGTGGFQTQVFSQPAIGIAGDFASMNPFSVFDVGAGGLVAGPAGVTIGNFAWVTPPLDPNSGPLLCNSFGAGNVSGFVGRNQQGSNSTYLSNAGMTVLGGYGVFLYTGGDFLCVNSTRLTPISRPAPLPSRRPARRRRALRRRAVRSRRRRHRLRVRSREMCSRFQRSAPARSIPARRSREPALPPARRSCRN